MAGAEHVVNLRHPVEPGEQSAQPIHRGEFIFHAVGHPDFNAFVKIDGTGANHQRCRRSIIPPGRKFRIFKSVTEGCVLPIHLHLLRRHNSHQMEFQFAAAEESGKGPFPMYDRERADTFLLPMGHGDPRKFPVKIIGGNTVILIQIVGAAFAGIDRHHQIGVAAVVETAAIALLRNHRSRTDENRNFLQHELPGNRPSPLEHTAGGNVVPLAFRQPDFGIGQFALRIDRRNHRRNQHLPPEHVLLLRRVSVLFLRIFIIERMAEADAAFERVTVLAVDVGHEFITAAHHIAH